MICLHNWIVLQLGIRQNFMNALFFMHEYFFDCPRRTIIRLGLENERVKMRPAINQRKQFFTQLPCLAVNQITISRPGST